jgi:SagB-type dehydrogenase family enzyme
MSETIALPPPDELGGLPLWLALGRRRSRRAFSGARAVGWPQIGQLLWALQGVSERKDGLRTAPSAGALYPLEIDAALASGVYRYVPASHALRQRDARDVRSALVRAAVGQSWLAEAACVFALSGVAARTQRRYGERAARYVHMEAGHAAQNLLLAAVSIGLDAVPVGAFDDDAVAQALRLSSGEAPLYLLPVG